MLGHTANPMDQFSPPALALPFCVSPRCDAAPAAFSFSTFASGGVDSRLFPFRVRPATDCRPQAAAGCPRAPHGRPCRRGRLVHIPFAHAPILRGVGLVADGDDLAPQAMTERCLTPHGTEGLSRARRPELVDSDSKET